MNTIPPITKNLLILNVIFYVITIILEKQGISLINILAAFFPYSPNFKIHQIITHMFMHGGTTHIFFNMFSLWMFGRIIEQTLEKKKFLILYFACGIGSYLLFNLVNLLQFKPIYDELVNLNAPISELSHYTKLSIEESINNAKVMKADQWLNTLSPAVQKPMLELYYYQTIPMLGASGAIYGILIAFGMLYPNMKLLLIFPPIPIKAKYLIPIMILIEFYLGIKNAANDNVAHFAHLGGALIGFILIFFWKKNRFRMN